MSTINGLFRPMVLERDNQQAKMQEALDLAYDMLAHIESGGSYSYSAYASRMNFIRPFVRPGDAK